MLRENNFSLSDEAHRARYRVSVLTEERYEAYTSFLLGIEHASLYASVKFKTLLEALLGATAEYLIALDARDRIAGALPLARIDGAYGPVVNSLPFFGSYGGIMVDPRVSKEDTELIRNRLRGAYAAYLSGIRAAASTVIVNPLEREASWYAKNWDYDFTDQRIGQLTYLPASTDAAAEELFSLFDEPRRRNIRKAVKSGIHGRASVAVDDLDFLCRAHQENIAALGGVSKEHVFFSLLASIFDDEDYRVYIAEKDGTRIAALLVFYFNKTVEYYIPAIVEEFRTFQPLSFLVFEAMKDAIRRGYRIWNWGGTWSSQRGVYDFKKRWGSGDYPYTYYTKIYDRSILECAQKELARQYPYCYVVPYKELKK